MTETPTTTVGTVFAKQYPLALQALGVHIEMHNLPPLVSVDTVTDHHFAAAPTTATLRLRLPATTAEQDAWLRSVVIDDEHTFEVEHGHRTVWEVRLPDTGFRFELVALRCHPLWKPVAL